MSLFLVIKLIENTEDIDYVLTIEANTEEQAKDYAIKNNLISCNNDQEIKVVSPKIHNASMHRIT